MGTTKTYGLGGGVACTSEIDDNTDDAVLWKDTAGIEMFELDSTNGSGYVAISADTDASNGKPYLKLVESSNYAELTANGYARFKAEANTAEIYGSDIREMISTTSSSWRIRVADESNYDLLLVDGDASNFTYAFHTADSGVFKVTDNAGSPVTYLSLTEGGDCDLGHSGGNSTRYGAQITERASTKWTLRMAGQPMLTAVYTAGGDGTYYIQHNGGNKTNCINVFGAQGTQDTGNTTHTALELLYNKTYSLAASGPSADVTSTVDFKSATSVPSGENEYMNISHVTIINSNATHNYIFKFNVQSGSGAVAACDADASNLTDGTGYLCAPGKTAVFEIRTLRIGGAAIANQVHMVRLLTKSQNTYALKQGKGVDTATTQAVYLANTAGNANDTLIVDFANGNVGDVTLTRNIDKVRFYNVPPDGLAASVTARITQGSSAHTISYADADVACYDDAGSTAITGEIKFSGGVHHTQSTGSGDVDVISFTSIPAGSTFDIYGAVIGQDFS